MERWTALLPDRPSSSPFPLHPKPKLIGRLPEEAYILILQNLPVPDINSFALGSRKFKALSRDDRVWKKKVIWLDYRGPGAILWEQQSETTTTTTAGHATDQILATSAPDSDFGDFFSPPQDDELPEESDVSLVHDDGFGDFQDFRAEPMRRGLSSDPFGFEDGFGEMQIGGASGGKKEKRRESKGDDLMMLFDDDEDEVDGMVVVPTPTSANGRKPTSPLTTNKNPTTPTTRIKPSSVPPPSSHIPTFHAPATLATPFHQIFRTHQSLLLPYYLSLLTHTTSSLLFTTPSLTPLSRSHLLISLTHFISSPLLSPTRSLPQRLTAKRNVQSALDFFESALLSEFERADSAGEEGRMREKVEILWGLREGIGESHGGGGVGGWNVVQVFVQKREVFYDQSHDPLKNLVKIETPSGTFADGIDFSSMNTYMTHILRVLTSQGSLITRVFPPQSDVLLYFLERLANDVISDYITVLLNSAMDLERPLFLLATAATFGQVYRLVNGVLEVAQSGQEGNAGMVTKERSEDVIFRMFESHMDDYLQEEGEWIREVLEGVCEEWDKKTASDLAISDPTFLASSNPAQVKRNVLAGFTKVLLLPVTIIPKTASLGLTAITYGATGAFNTFASIGTQITGSRTPVLAGASPEIGVGVGGGVVVGEKVLAAQEDRWSSEGGRASIDQSTGKVSFDGGAGLSIDSPSSSTTPKPMTMTTTTTTTGNFDRLQLLLSLDTALQLIQANRDCLKRIQTFIRYPGSYGQKVRDAIEEVFIILLQVLGEKHVCPAFDKATKSMSGWKPEEHDAGVGGGEGGGGGVAPLVQFFELVHIGDTIQQMVEVYFDKEMATYIDKKDFLNAVVREKKRFETSLDDAVAQGLNAAVNILMNQVEHIILTRQDPRDFSPADGVDLDLRPTKACNEAIGVLTTHCDMLKGSTDKQILEVFHTEVGIRLHGILLKHLKRQIISIEGGFQLISDLNAYHAFISTLRQPQLTSYFTSLKMVGEIYIVDSPKDLGQLVRDVSRYEGTLSADDLYECVQRRTDWKRIESQVEKQLFGLRVSDDCSLM